MSNLSVGDVEIVLNSGHIPLRDGEIADWKREAEMLMAAADPSQTNREISTLVYHRLNGVPLAYLVGSERFLGRDFSVEPGVVIPHPATELVASAAIAALVEARTRVDRPQLMEFGVGVGNIVISCLSAVDGVVAYASDSQGAALRLAQRNAAAILEDSERLRLLQAYEPISVIEPFLFASVRDIDVVVANPPYLIEGDPVSDATQRSGVTYLGYAPVRDPSWFLRRLLDAPAGFLREDCSIVMECAHLYQSDHQAVMDEAGWDTQFLSREEYAEAHGLPSSAFRMRPTPHRVMCATRGRSRAMRASRCIPGGR